MPRPSHTWLPFLAALTLGLLLAACWVSQPSASPQQDQGPFLPFVTQGQGQPTPTPPPGPTPIIVDHRSPLGFPDMPDFARLGANETRLLVRHASVGENISDGLDCLAGAHPTAPGCETYTPGTYDRSNWDFQNRGNPGWQAKIDDLVAETAAYAADFDGFTMKFCYIDALGDASPDWETYRDAMLQLESDYPDQTFIWWTIPLTSGGNAGADRFNGLVRTYARLNGKVLFDIADIESYDPPGTITPAPPATRSCTMPTPTTAGTSTGRGASGLHRLSGCWWRASTAGSGETAEFAGQAARLKPPQNASRASPASPS